MQNTLGGTPMPPSSTTRMIRWVLFITAAALLLIVALLGYYAWQSKSSDNLIPEEVITLSPETYGFTAGQPTTTVALTGQIIYTSPNTLTQDPQNPSYTYTYDLNSGELATFFSQPTRDWSESTDGVIGVIAPRDASNTPQSWQPHVYNSIERRLKEVDNMGGFFTNDLAYSPDGRYYAYSYRSEIGDTTNLGYIDGWTIAIHDTSTGEVLTIDNAAEPTWINNGADILYTSPDGIFRYNLDKREAINIFADYLPISYSDDLAVSSDSKHVILTAPYLVDKHAIILFQFSNADSIGGILTERGRIVSTENLYSHPVFSPNGEYYAVATTIPVETGDSKDVIEIRQIDKADPITSLTLPTGEETGISIEAWSPEQ